MARLGLGSAAVLEEELYWLQFNLFNSLEV